MAKIIVIKGMENILRKLEKFPGVIRENMGAAGAEASEEILNTEGLRNYPPHTDANLPPAPYYIRGRGMQYASGNAENSERYGTLWNTATSGYRTTIGNRATYAPYLGGEKQARAMKPIGWRKLFDVAQEKRAKLTAIYAAWVARAKQQAGL